MKRIINHARALARSVLPQRSRRLLRKLHRDFVFRRAMRRFIRNPEALTDSSHPLFAELVYGWGNEGWSGLSEYLAACVAHALGTRGPILECGSGLSTLLVGTVAKKRGLAHWSLEHVPEWATTVQMHLDRYAIDSVVLCARPLKDYGDYSWYDPPIESMPPAFSLVICDGPPASTKGGRYPLTTVLGSRLQVGTTVLLDDAHREPEVEIARRWKDELDARFEIIGSERPFIKMTI